MENNAGRFIENYILQISDQKWFVAALEIPRPDVWNSVDYHFNYTKSSDIQTVGDQWPVPVDHWALRERVEGSFSIGKIFNLVF